MAISFDRPTADTLVVEATREARPGASTPSHPGRPDAAHGAPGRGHEMLDLFVATFVTISEYRPSWQ